MTKRLRLTIMRHIAIPAVAGILATLSPTSSAGAQAPSADERATATEARMTDDERFTLLHGVMALPGPTGMPVMGSDAVPGAGYIAGIPSLGIPSLRETDASLGVTNPSNARPGDTATALPAGIMLGATFDPALARAAGAMAGAEARAKGFNVLLAGGLNLMRDPRNGRNFEYLSEDPLLSGVMAGAEVAGVQSQGIISTVKHFALNGQETDRETANSMIDPAANRESDLLAFQIAIERGHPGAVMCSYNKVNGDYACDNDELLNHVLKGAWAYPGWVMSDWGVVRSVSYAINGLDQQSGAQLDKQVWFDAPLKAALKSGQLSRARLSDMVRRILRSIYASGIDKPGPASPIDLSADRKAALDVARAGIVLIKNDGILPLAAQARTIAVIGGHADIGVILGGGSSEVTPTGGFAARIPLGGEGVMAAWRNEKYIPSSPLVELRKLLPQATLMYDPGVYPAEAAALARRADVVIVFATKYELEAHDSADLSLPSGQDEVIRAAVAANPNTIVVLETGNPIAMPWGKQVRAIVEAWYPGQAGGQAIAEVLTGAVNPSGRLPISFPADIQATPRPQLPGFGMADGTDITVNYTEGADVGYRWFARTAQTPLYAFGHGLSYTRFRYEKLTLSGGTDVSASFTVCNSGTYGGADVPQVYVTAMAGKPALRLVGFNRVMLAPGECKPVTQAIDQRLLASFDTHAGRWTLPGGQYRIALARAADDLVTSQTITLGARMFGR